MSTRESLRGALAVVTGGSRGIGKAIADAFAREGTRVIAASRSASRPFATGPLEHGVVHEARLDVTVAAEVDAFFQAVAAAGALDVLVLNAGIGIFKPLEELACSDWQRVLDVNLTGAFLCARRALPLMSQCGGGRIIGLGSVADHTPFANSAAYCASKFGLRALLQVITEEGKTQGVFASLVSSGAVRTDIWAERSGFDPADMLDPSDVAELVLDIASRPRHVRIDEVRLMPRKGIL